MKLLNMLGISKRNQLKKHIFVYIVIILFCLLFVFLIVSNLDNIWRNIHQTDKEEMDSRAEYQEVLRMSDKLEQEQGDKAGAAEYTGEEKTAVWGQETDSYQITALQLANMKEDYRTEAELGDCAGAEILFICRTDFTDPELQMLKQYSEEGTTLFFTEIPSEAALENQNVRDLLGIDTYKGIQVKRGSGLPRAFYSVRSQRAGNLFL